MFKKSIYAVILSSCSLVAIGAEFESPQASGKGIYLEGLAAYSHVNQTIEPGPTDNDGFGWGINFGYNFNQNFAIEAGYRDLATVNKDLRFLGTIKDEYYTLHVAGKYTAPVGEKFGLFAKLGIAYVNSDLKLPPGVTLTKGSASEAALYYGVGLNYNLTDKFYLIGYVDGTSRNGDAAQTTLAGGGIGYRF